MKTARKPLASINAPKQMANPEDNMTVEQYLENYLDGIVKDFGQHTNSLITKLKDEYVEGAQSINDLMNKNKTEEERICVNLKCVAGPHIGQRFRLEPLSENGDDVFKIGRSTGKLFKEKGVSLYKDKEISTTHAKVEIRNGIAFLVDANSTNGTQLNNADIEAITPLRLKDGDVITVGSTDLQVHIAILTASDLNTTA
jgi:hypothetical protein